MMKHYLKVLGGGGGVVRLGVTPGAVRSGAKPLICTARPCLCSHGAAMSVYIFAMTTGILNFETRNCAIVKKVIFADFQMSL